MAASPVRLRPFAAADQDAVRRPILAGLGDRFGVVDASRNPDLDDIAAAYPAPGAFVVVAEVGAEIVGSGILIDEAAGVGRLVRMSVAGHHRRRGIGRALVAHLVERARERGHRRLLLETKADWFDAIRLYESCGFVAFDRKDGDLHLALDLRSAAAAPALDAGPEGTAAPGRRAAGRPARS